MKNLQTKNLIFCLFTLFLFFGESQFAFGKVAKKGVRIDVIHGQADSVKVYNDHNEMTRAYNASIVEASTSVALSKKKKKPKYVYTAPLACSESEKSECNARCRSNNPSYAYGICTPIPGDDGRSAGYHCFCTDTQKFGVGGAGNGHDPAVVQ